MSDPWQRWKELTAEQDALLERQAAAEKFDRILHNAIRLVLFLAIVAFALAFVP